MLGPAVVTAVLDGVFHEMRPDVRGASMERLRADLATIEREIARLTEAIATGGEMAALLDALKTRQTRQSDLQRVIARADGQKPPQINRTSIERQVRERLTRWRSMLTTHAQDSRQLFREALVGPIRFTPEKAAGVYRFEGEVALGELFTGIAGLAPFMASPTRFSKTDGRRRRRAAAAGGLIRTVMSTYRACGSTNRKTIIES